MAEKHKLLINWVHYGALGHAVEAYKVATGFRVGNPDLDITLLISSAVGSELGQCLPIDSVVPVELAEFEIPDQPRRIFKDLPRDWDYVYSQDRGYHSERLNRFHEEFHAWVRGRLCKTNNDAALPDFPLPQGGSTRFELPAANRTFADEFWRDAGDCRISILTGSSTFQKAPTVEFWRRALRALSEECAPVDIVLIGRLGGTLHIAENDIRGILDDFPNVRNGFDLPLLDQLAIIEQCKLHISPHSGMSFAVQCVGVPWLVLSSTTIYEYLLNGVPFWCVYPECGLYPCGQQTMLPECRALMEEERQPVCLQDAALMDRMPDFMEGAKMLIENRVSYRECTQRHIRELNRKGFKGDFSSLVWDGITTMKQ